VAGAADGGAGIRLRVSLEGASRGVALAKAADALLQLRDHFVFGTSAYRAARVEGLELLLSARPAAGGRAQRSAVEAFLPDALGATWKRKSIVVGGGALRAWCEGGQAAAWAGAVDWAAAQLAAETEAEAEERDRLLGDARAAGEAPRDAGTSAGPDGAVLMSGTAVGRGL
jgi:hypothetical protein